VGDVAASNAAATAVVANKCLLISPPCDNTSTQRTQRRNGPARHTPREIHCAPFAREAECFSRYMASIVLQLLHCCIIWSGSFLWSISTRVIDGPHASHAVKTIVNEMRQLAVDDSERCPLVIPLRRPRRPRRGLHSFRLTGELSGARPSRKEG